MFVKLRLDKIFPNKECFEFYAYALLKLFPRTSINQNEWCISINNDEIEYALNIPEKSKYINLLIFNEQWTEQEKSLFRKIKQLVERFLDTEQNSNNIQINVYDINKYKTISNEKDINEKNIKLVMEQTNCERDFAIISLISANLDIVQAIFFANK